MHIESLYDRREAVNFDIVICADTGERLNTDLDSAVSRYIIGKVARVKVAFDGAH